jgi:hypothetical protein
VYLWLWSYLPVHIFETFGPAVSKFHTVKLAVCVFFTLELIVSISGCGAGGLCTYFGLWSQMSAIFKTELL